MKLLFYLETRWTVQIGSTGLLLQPIVHHFPIYLLWQPWCITWLLWPVQKTVSPSKLSTDAHYSLRYRHMHAGPSSRPTPKVPALKQFIEASLHGHSLWNSNCYLIWLQVLPPLHLRATLKRPFLHSTCVTQQSRSSLNAIIFTSFA